MRSAYSGLVGTAILGRDGFVATSERRAWQTAAGVMPRDVVFVSYSHADRDWLTRLLVLPAPAVRNRRLELWAYPLD